MANKWFETVAEAQRRAKKRLPKSVYGALIAGSERGLTLEDNITAYSRAGLRPPRGRPGRRAGTWPPRSWARRSRSPSSSPPPASRPCTPGARSPWPRAAAARGTAMGLSSFASMPVEDVVAANPQTFFQIYWIGTRDQIAARVERARAAGAVGLIATLDWSFSHGRDWGSPTIPETVDLRAMLRFAPEALAHPRWLLSFARTGQVPRPDHAEHGGQGPDRARRSSAPTASGWGRRRRVGTTWPGCASSGAAPFMLKGVSRVDDAKRAVDAGVSAISVSNHGGNNLDGTPATIRALPAVADAVGDQIDVLLDGGIRRGGDAVKALALGAKAVMIGRASLWGLAANGQAGVENVLDIMRSGIESALLGLGHASIHDLSPDDLVIPEGFSRHLG